MRREAGFVSTLLTEEALSAYDRQALPVLFVSPRQIRHLHLSSSALAKIVIRDLFVSPRQIRHLHLSSLRSYADGRISSFKSPPKERQTKEVRNEELRERHSDGSKHIQPTETTTASKRDGAYVYRLPCTQYYRPLSRSPRGTQYRSLLPVGHATKLPLVDGELSRVSRLRQQPEGSHKK